MMFFFQIISFIAWVLIAIGDATILIFNIIRKLIISACKFILYLIDNLIKSITFIIHRFIILLFFFPRKITQYTTSLFKKIFLKKKRFPSRPITKHIKKNGTIVIFSLTLKTRIKYFVAGTFFSFLFLFLPLIVFVFLQDLPSPKMIWLGQIPQTTKIYDRNNILLYQIYASQNRTLIPLNDVPTQLQEATISIEDKDFYSHIGFDLSAIIRSAIRNVSGEDFQGGSTITQQLVKSALLSPETSITRKLKEVILAFWTERLYTKRQILEMYFNQIPYGGTAWGIEAASEIYFGQHTKDLDLAQSAFLAGIPQAPTLYSPYGINPHAWKTRQKEVLSRMVDLKYITQQQEEQAESEELTFLPPQNPIHAPHFVTYVRDLLVKKYGLPLVERGGLTVITSLDLHTQDMAQKIVTDEIASDSNLHVTNGAALVTNPQNGDILAMIGNHDFSDPNGGNVNITTSLRQPGSSIKPVTYSLALSSGFTAATILDDSPVTYTSLQSPSYSPVNYDGRFHGKIPLRIALANSFNIPAVRLLNQLGINNFISLGKKMGITSWGDPQNYGLSITLGSAEVMPTDMATVYGVLANGGQKVDLNPFLKITDDKGQVLEEKTSTQPIFDGTNEINFGTRVLDEGVTFIMSDILADNAARATEFGINSPLFIPNHYVSVKTGTSDDKRDNWTIGYTKNWVVTVWVGNNDNSPMSQALASGITGAAPIWHKIMQNLLQITPEPKPIMPLDIVTKNCYGKPEYFIRGSENSVNCAAAPSPSPTKHL